MREELATCDARIALVAARQFGVVAVDQLREAGFGRSALSRRLEAGRLHRIHRGVYAVGHRGLSWRGRWMAAVLAIGNGAVLSHGSAAALWEFIKPIAGPIHVTVPGDAGRAGRPGLRIHRSCTLHPADVTRRHGIPVSTPKRTIADLDGTVEPYLLRRAIRQAELAGHRLGNGVSSGRTRSDLERDFLLFCRRWRIPKPAVNVRVGRFLVDFFWAEAGVAVETDSWSYHRGSVAFEDDHDRDLELRRRRIDLIRVTGRELDEKPGLVAELLKHYF